MNISGLWGFDLFRVVGPVEVIIRFCKLKYRDETSIQSHPKCVVGIEVTREVIRGITGDTAGDLGGPRQRY